MEESGAKVDIHRGLKGVYFDRSRVCYIDGRAGELRYRGDSIHDLAEHSTFEETCYLLLKGELPTRPQLEAFTAELKAARALPPAIYDVIRTVKNAHPMDVLRTAVPHSNPRRRTSPSKRRCAKASASLPRCR